MKSFSSGEVAKICDVTPRTVIRWIDAGRIMAFKLPGRGNNRISESELLAFLSKNNMPVPDELKTPVDEHCVIISQDLYLLKHARRMIREADFVVASFDSGLEAGFEIALKKPSLIVLDEDIESATSTHMKKQIEQSLDYAPSFIVFSSDTKVSKSQSNQAGFTRLTKPISLNSFADAIEMTKAKRKVLSRV